MADKHKSDDRALGYDDFSRADWAQLRGSTPMTLREEDLPRLEGLGDVLSLDEVEKIYLPLCRLLSLHIAASRRVKQVTSNFLGRPLTDTPYIIAIAGSVGVGKSTIARVLRALLSALPYRPVVDLVTTDGFLYPNAELERRHLMKRKGFPESYDLRRLIQFLAAVRAGEPDLDVPVYSHLVYDLVPGEVRRVSRPGILIVEGLNVLQNVIRAGATDVLVSDFFDFTIYVDAEEEHIRQWYVDRFLTLQHKAFRDPASFFHRYSKLSRQEAIATAQQIWDEVNHPNLVENILPTRGRARLILQKGCDHLVERVRQRKILGRPLILNDLVNSPTEPRDVGLSAKRLNRIHEALTEQVAAGEIPGAVALVHRAGRTAWWAAVGTRAVDSKEPINLNAIFRVYSMTKPFTSVAALALVEEGQLDLSAPVGQYLPELADLRVVSDLPSDGQSILATVPARRPMSVHDLFCHTSGLVGGYQGSSLLRTAYLRSDIIPFDHTRMALEQCSQDLVDALARLPLAHQPGTVWEYGRSGDVLGRVLEVVSGRPLDVVLAERIFTPLGMVDTGFHVPPGKAGRIVQPASSFSPNDPVIDITESPRFLSGGSGCYATALDYLRFGRMVLGRGELGGQQVLSPKSMALATSDHLGTLAGSGPDYIPGPGYGFGLGFAVRRAEGEATTLGSTGDLWWLGRASTSFVVDPREDLIAILMTQRYWTARRYQAWFKNLVYQAIVA